MCKEDGVTESPLSGSQAAFWGAGYSSRLGGEGYATLLLPSVGYWHNSEVLAVNW